MNTSQLGTKAMLATLTISIWSARKLDKAATAKTTTEAGANADAARVNKHLLAGQDAALKACQTIASAARAEHYRLTLPWNDNGPRILPVSLWKPLNTALQTSALTFQAAVDAFLIDYEQARDRARFSLGALFSDSDFPSARKVASKFSFDFNFENLPDASDFRAALADDEADMIRKDMQARAADRYAAAMRDVWTRLYDAIQHISTTLPAYDNGNVKRFNDSIIGNLGDLLAILPGLNLTNDPQLSAIADRAAAELAGINPQTLRDDPTARSRATSSATAICSTMAGFLGIDRAAAPAPVVSSTPAQAAPAQVFDLFTAPVRAA